VESNVKRHAKKALRDLDTYISVQRELSQVVIEQADKPFEIQTYIRMVQTDDSFTQRLAARAAFHETVRDPELMSLFAEKLENLYMNPELDALGQDTAAWMCKVLKKQPEYTALLAEVAEKSPHRKIQKYAK
jgi:acyl transferase domain-containing protein